MELKSYQNKETDRSYERYKSCRSKKKFELNKAKVTSNQYKQNYYKCIYCENYHLTSRILAKMD